MQQLGRAKVPHFFIYAKGKKETQVEPIGHGVVDRLYYKVQIYPFRFKANGWGTFDYRMLMYNKDLPYGEKEEAIVQNFRRLASHIGSMAPNGFYGDDSRYDAKFQELRQTMLTYGSRQYIVDVLVRGLFFEHKVQKKTAFWCCFGDVVYDNLVNSIAENKRAGLSAPARPTTAPPSLRMAYCVLCGDGFMTSDVVTSAVCPSCMMSRYMDIGNMTRCLTCGTPLPVSPKRGRRTVRCSSCQKDYNKQRKIKSKK